MFCLTNDCFRIKSQRKESESHVCFIEGHYTTSSIRQQAPVGERGQRQGHANTFPIAYSTYGEGKKQLAELIRARRTP